MLAKSMVKMIILLDIGVIVHPLQSTQFNGLLQIQFFHLVSRNRDVLKFYKDWDTDSNSWWTIKKEVAITWESTNSILNAWKSQSQK